MNSFVKKSDFRYLIIYNYLSFYTIYFLSFFLHSTMLQIPYQKDFFDITSKTLNLEKKVVNKKGGNLGYYYAAKG